MADEEPSIPPFLRDLQENPPPGSPGDPVNNLYQCLLALPEVPRGLLALGDEWAILLAGFVKDYGADAILLAAEPDHPIMVWLYCAYSHLMYAVQQAHPSEHFPYQPLTWRDVPHLVTMEHLRSAVNLAMVKAAVTLKRKELQEALRLVRRAGGLPLSSSTVEQGSQTDRAAFPEPAQPRMAPWGQPARTITRVIVRPTPSDTPAPPSAPSAAAPTPAQPSPDTEAPSTPPPPRVSPEAARAVMVRRARMPVSLGARPRTQAQWAKHQETKIELRNLLQEWGYYLPAETFLSVMPVTGDIRVILPTPAAARTFLDNQDSKEATVTRPDGTKGTVTASLDLYWVPRPRPEVPSDSTLGKLIRLSKEVKAISQPRPRRSARRSATPADAMVVDAPPADEGAAADATAASPSTPSASSPNGAGPQTVTPVLPSVGPSSAGGVEESKLPTSPHSPDNRTTAPPSANTTDLVLPDAPALSLSRTFEERSLGSPQEGGATPRSIRQRLHSPPRSVEGQQQQSDPPASLLFPPTPLDEEGGGRP